MLQFIKKLFLSGSNDQEPIMEIELSGELTTKEVSYEDENQELLALFTEEIEATDVLIESKKSELVSILILFVDSAQPFDVSRIFKDKTPLAPQEKKELGLNSRKKYTKEFLEYFETDKLTSCPKDLVNEMYQRASQELYRRKSLRRISETKIGKYRISYIDDSHSCSKCKEEKGKLYLPDELPKLPLEGCTAKVCRCSYMRDRNSIRRK